MQKSPSRFRRSAEAPLIRRLNLRHVSGMGTDMVEGMGVSPDCASLGMRT